MLAAAALMNGKNLYCVGETVSDLFHSGLFNAFAFTHGKRCLINDKPIA